MTDSPPVGMVRGQNGEYHMKHASICKSECGTWYVIALVKDEEGYDYGVVYEGNRKKDCVLWVEEHMKVVAA